MIQEMVSQCRLHASQVAGIIIAPVAITFMVYSLLVYRRRSSLIISRQDVRYDDQKVPDHCKTLLREQTERMRTGREPSWAIQLHTTATKPGSGCNSTQSTPICPMP